MPGSMAPLRKPRNTTRLPLALNPMKSKDVLAVLAERNQTVVPVGAWVEPASPYSSEIPAYTSAYKIEEELKEQLRKKQEALKHFQRQVKYRVNQQIKLRKKQQLQRSHEAAKKIGSLVMQSSDPTLLVSKRASVFPNNVNAVIRSAQLPPSQMLGDEIEDRENQDEVFQQAQALRQSMKQAHHRLASFKTVNKNASVIPDGRRKSFSSQEKPDSEDSLPAMIEEKERENLFWRDQKDHITEDNIPSIGVQKVQFKNPLFAVMEEEKLKQLQNFEDILPQAQNDFPEAQGDLVESQDDLTEIQSVEPNTQAIELEDQAVAPEVDIVDSEAQAIKTETQGIMPESQSSELEAGSIDWEVQDFLPQNQTYLTENQNFVPKDQHVLSKVQNVLLRREDQNFLPTDQDQDFPPKDRDFLYDDQKANLKPSESIWIGRREREAFPLAVHQNFLDRHGHHSSVRDKNLLLEQPSYFMEDERPREEAPQAYQNVKPKIQDHASLREENKYIKQPSSFEKWETDSGLTAEVPSEQGDYDPPSYNVTNGSWRKELFPEWHRYVSHKMQNPVIIREQSSQLPRPPPVGEIERWREDRPLDGHHPVPSKHQRKTCSKRQVYDEYRSGLSTKFQNPLTLHFGVDQEEDRKERQKQYLRCRRLFMDIEREQVKEQQRQKEQKKKIEKIKRKKEQQRYAEEQRILRMNCPEEPHSGEKMSEMLAQLQLEEIKEAKEKQQREKEYLRYVEALRAQIQEKMQLYNITLPPLCCCGPGFWDAHPDTCANNCIFYKNHKAYTRALHSVINSCDIPAGNLALRAAIRNYASAYGQTLKNL